MSRSKLRPTLMAWLVPGLLAAPGSRVADAQQTGGAASTNTSSSKRIEGAAMGLAPPGGLYGFDNQPQADDPNGEEVKTEVVAVPETHVVKKGDTLWSLCDQYFKDPWRWPKLWAGNPAITNPHWIFPGDSVRLRAPTEVPVAAAPAAAAPGDAAGMKITRAQGALGGNAVTLRQLGYIEAKDLETAALISGSREEKIMLATGDQAYLSFDKKKPLRAGDRYTVFEAHKQEPVRDPDTHAILGYLVEVRGDIVVDQVTGDGSARGVLVDMVQQVERGYTVSQQVRQFRRIEPRPSNVDLDARIVASFIPTNFVAPETFVVLSRGSKDGVQVGNRTFVVRRGDGYRRILEGWEKFDPRYPKEVVGEALVVDVRDGSSLAWITRSAKELRVGEVTEMRKGH